MTQTTSRLDASLLLVLAAGAVALMLIAGLSDRPPSTAFPEELYHAQAARDIASGSVPRYNRTAAARVEPLYALTLAPIWAMTGPDEFPWWARVVNVALLLSTVFPAYRLARLATPRPIAVMAAIAAVLWPGTLLYRFLVVQNLLIPLATWTALAGVALVRRPTAPRAVGVGFLAGLILLTDGRLFPVVVALGAALLVLRIRPKHLLITVGVAAAIAAPWFVGRAVLAESTVGRLAPSLWAEFMRTGPRPLGEYARWLATGAATWLTSLGALVVALAAYEWLGALRSRERPRRACAVLSGTVAVAFTAVAAFWAAQNAESRGVVDERSLAAAAPLLIVAFATAAHRRERRPFGFVVSIGIVAAVAWLAPWLAFAGGREPELLAEYPASLGVAWLGDVDRLPGESGPWRVRIASLIPLALMLLVFVRRRWATCGLAVALVWPWAGLAIGSFGAEAIRKQQALRVEPLIAWLADHVEPEDSVIHHGLASDLPYHTAMRFNREHCAVHTDFIPVANSAVRFDGDNGRFTIEGRTGRTLMITESLPSWSEAYIAKFGDVRLVDLSDGLARRGAWLGLAPPPLFEPQSDHVTADRMCEPDTTIRWSVEYPHDYSIGIVLEHPADTPLQGSVAVRVQGPNGGIVEKTIEKGESVTIARSIRLWVPVVRVHIRCNRSFESDGRRLSLRIKGLYLQRQP